MENTVPIEKIGERLKQLRTATGLTQSQLAEICNIKQSSISFIERGKIRNITVKTLYSLCSALKISPLDFLKAE